MAVKGKKLIVLIISDSFYIYPKGERSKITETFYTKEKTEIPSHNFFCYQSNLSQLVKNI